MVPSTRSALKARSANVPPPAVCTRKRVSAQKRPRANVDPPRRSARVRLREAAEAAGSDAVPSDIAPSESTVPEQFGEDALETSRVTAKRKKKDDLHGPALKRRKGRSVLNRGGKVEKKERPVPVVPALPGIPVASNAAQEQFLRLMADPPPVSPSDIVNAGYTVCKEVREILVDWMMEVANEYQARPETLALAVSYLDRILFRLNLLRRDLQLLAAVCVMVACKMEETDPPSISDLIYLCDHMYSREAVLEMEKIVIMRLEFRLSGPTYANAVEKIAREVARDYIRSPTFECDCIRIIDDLSDEDSPRKMACCQQVGKSAHPVEEKLVEASMFAARIALHDKAVSQFAPCAVAAGCVMAACATQQINVEFVTSCMGLKNMWSKHYDDVRAAEARVFDVMQTLLKRHDVDKSRFVLLKWPRLTQQFATAADNFEPYVASELESDHEVSEIATEMTLSLLEMDRRRGQPLPR